MGLEEGVLTAPPGSPPSPVRRALSPPQLLGALLHGCCSHLTYLNLARNSCSHRWERRGVGRGGACHGHPLPC